VSLPRRLGRIARGFVYNLQEDERLRETLRPVRERGEALRGAFEAALKGASEEWRAAEERRTARERVSDPGGWRTSGMRDSSTIFAAVRYPQDVLTAYKRLGLVPGTPIEEVDRKRRELVKRYHPDRFSDPGERVRAERITAEINAAHDKIERHLLRK
jgi:DnaJ-domain-containing protein 1